jgi:N-acylneuraminate cytidylyltransferase
MDSHSHINPGEKKISGPQSRKEPSFLLGVIPARGGSKGIPRKNVRPICGHPLIAWTIAAARASSELGDFVLSTEDREIAEAARAYGAKILERPEELARDEAASRDVVLHALSALKAQTAVLLQPTSPVRRAGLIDRVIRAFREGEWDSMATGFMQPLYPPHGVEHRRQDIKSVFVNDGSVIVARREQMERGSLFGKRAGTLVTSREENVDIDESFDFFMAEKILEKALAEGWMSPPALA